MLHDFLRDNRTEILKRTRAKVAARQTPLPTADELQSGLPLFLDQLTDKLARRVSGVPAQQSSMDDAAARHGGELLAQGFTVAQVVHDYGEVCQAVTELAQDLDVLISAEDFQAFNGCLDSAIAAAVSEFSRMRQASDSRLELQRLGVLAHELRNLLSTATVGFQLIRQGTVAAGGTTASVIERSLVAMRKLVDRTLAEVRLDAGIEALETLRVAEVVEDVELAASMDAAGRRLRFSVDPVPYTWFVRGDRHLLAAALTNLVQNAFKFTRSDGAVKLTSSLEQGRVLLSVEDECGGLEGGVTHKLFQPFAQQDSDRSGLGLGLSIANKSVRAMGGELHVRDLPGSGCVFTVDLPQVAADLAGIVRH